MRLGHISELFESGNRGPGTISDGTGDPGGKSYGIYQLSKITLYQYVQRAPFKFNTTLFTIEFDNEWIETAEKYTTEFALDQWLFITEKLYLPNIIFARSLGYQTENKKVQEAVFSIAVQHGGASQIIKNAYKEELYIDSQITSLYDTRISYVKKLGLGDALTKALLSRYKKEVEYVLNLAE